MSSFPTTIRKRALKARGFFRQVGQNVQNPATGVIEFVQFPVGTGPIRNAAGEGVGGLWAQAA